MSTSIIRQREGRSIPEGPYEGVPPHLRSQLKGWLREFCSDTDGYTDAALINQLAAILRIEVSPARNFHLFDELTKWAAVDDERLLDLIHCALQINPPVRQRLWKDLEILLVLGGSVWRATDTGLERRVDPTAMEAFDATTAIADSSSDHLQLAWSHAYGRNPDPSDAWDHAIKAVETILIPIVCPTKDKANLGSVAGDLKAQPGRFTFGLESAGIGGIETLEAMLRLMWPNPDRHGGGPNSRVPTIEEARAVVQLAVTIVQWGRDRQILKR